MLRSFTLLTLLTLSLIVLNGCAHKPNPAPSAHHSHWEAEGKIAINTAKEHTSATFNWQQNQNDYRLRFFGPFGLGTVWLVKEGKQVWFEDQEHGKQTAASAEHLMRKHLGWQLPVSDLRYWLQGLPSPTSPIIAMERNPQGQLIQLQQQGWNMTFSQHQAHGSQWLPGKLVASQGSIKVVIITKTWITPPTLTLTP